MELLGGKCCLSSSDQFPEKIARESGNGLAKTSTTGTLRQKSPPLLWSKMTTQCRTNQKSTNLPPLCKIIAHFVVSALKRSQLNRDAHLEKHRRKMPVLQKKCQQVYNVNLILYPFFKLKVQPCVEKGMSWKLYPGLRVGLSKNNQPEKTGSPESHPSELSGVWVTAHLLHSEYVTDRKVSQKTLTHQEQREK